jgi:hypothetical protein
VSAKRPPVAVEPVGQVAIARYLRRQPPSDGRTGRIDGSLRTVRQDSWGCPRTRGLRTVDRVRARVDVEVSVRAERRVERPAPVEHALASNAGGAPLDRKLVRALLALLKAVLVVVLFKLLLALL